MSKDNQNNKKEGVNKYYKISTIILGLVVVMFGIWFASNQIKQNGLEEGYAIGQDEVINKIIFMANDKGYIELVKNDETLVLVDSKIVEKSQEELIKQILNEVKQNGMVKIYDNTTEMILVPYVPEQ